MDVSGNLENLFVNLIEYSITHFKLNGINFATKRLVWLIFPFLVLSMKYYKSQLASYSVDDFCILQQKVQAVVAIHVFHICWHQLKQEGLAVASIARDDPSTLPGDDAFPRTRMHRDRNAR